MKYKCHLGKKSLIRENKIKVSILFKITAGKTKWLTKLKYVQQELKNLQLNFL